MFTSIVKFAPGAGTSRVEGFREIVVNSAAPTGLLTNIRTMLANSSNMAIDTHDVFFVVLHTNGFLIFPPTFDYVFSAFIILSVVSG